MKNNKLINLYHSFFRSREEERDEALIRGFIGKFPNNTPYDLEIIDRFHGSVPDCFRCFMRIIK